MATNIYFYVPNIIDYGRLILAFISFYFMQTNYVLAIVLYMISANLDHIDGVVARALKQESRFGAMLDQIIDRLAFMGLSFNLSMMYPQHALLIQSLTALDIGCNWLHSVGFAFLDKEKTAIRDPYKFKLVKWYHKNATVMFVLVATNDIFHAAVYLYYFTAGPNVPALDVGMVAFAAIATFPFVLVKISLSILTLINACNVIVTLDRRAKSKVNGLKEERDKE